MSSASLRGEVSKTTRPGAAPGDMLLRRAVTGMWPTRKAPALQAGSCGSVTRRLQCCAWQYFHRGLIRLADCKSVVAKRVGSRRVEHYHQLPPFVCARVPKPKSSRRTVVNRVINECESRRDRHGSFSITTSGTRKTSIRSAWNREPSGGAPGCPTTFPPCSSGAELVTSNHMVAGAIPAREISQVLK